MLKYISSPSQPIQIGDRVQIEGLTNSLQYNDKEGVVIKIGNGSEARMTVLISSDNKVRVKSSNLIFKHRQETAEDATKDSAATTHDEEQRDDVSIILDCSTCNKPQTSDFILKICQCRTKHYCDKQCQKKDYKQHKKECLRLVQEQKQKSLKEDGTKDGKKEMPIQEAEDKEDCPICTDALPKLSGDFTRLSCCGKGLHQKCYKDLMENRSMTLEQKNTCIMCRAQLVRLDRKKILSDSVDGSRREKHGQWLCWPVGTKMV
jgi:hypothetical protein